METNDTEKEIFELEKTALEQWNHGNPSGYLNLFSKEITYFDPFHSKRIDGFDAMKELYESLRGQIAVDKHEFIDPKVQVGSDMAVLTFNLVSHEGAESMRWNCTEVYRREQGQWKIIHNHWSLIGEQ